MDAPKDENEPLEAISVRLFFSEIKAVEIMAEITAACKSCEFCEGSVGRAKFKNAGKWVTSLALSETAIWFLTNGISLTALWAFDICSLAVVNRLSLFAVLAKKIPVNKRAVSLCDIFIRFSPFIGFFGSFFIGQSMFLTITSILGLNILLLAVQKNANFIVLLFF